MAFTIDVEEGVQDMWVGESIKFTINTKGATAGSGLDATPTSIGTAILYDETGADVTGAESDAGESLSTDTITTAIITPNGVGRYIYIVPVVVAGSTLYQRLKIQVRDATPY
jgi:hypothetical protein